MRLRAYRVRRVVGGGRGNAPDDRSRRRDDDAAHREDGGVVNFPWLFEREMFIRIDGRRNRVNPIGVKKNVFKS